MNDALEAHTARRSRPPIALVWWVHAVGPRAVHDVHLQRRGQLPRVPLLAGVRFHAFGVHVWLRIVRFEDVHRSRVELPPGALVSFIQKGLQYLELEANLNEVRLHSTSPIRTNRTAPSPASHPARVPPRQSSASVRATRRGTDALDARPTRGSRGHEVAARLARGHRVTRASIARLENRRTRPPPSRAPPRPAPR